MRGLRLKPNGRGGMRVPNTKLGVIGIYSAQHEEHKIKAHNQSTKTKGYSYHDQEVFYREQYSIRLGAFAQHLQLIHHKNNNPKSYLDFLLFVNNASRHIIAS